MRNVDDLNPVRVARRAWVAAPAASDFRARCAAVLASSTPDSVLSHTAAARLHRLWLPAGMDDIHVATSTAGVRGRTMLRTQRPEVRSHRLELRPEDVTVVDGLPVTSLTRTWRDLAGMLGLAALVAAGDSGLQAGMTGHDLQWALGGGAGARGIRRARLAAPLLDARSRSRPESHLRVHASARGAIALAVNEPVHRREGGWLAEPDLSIEQARIALEYQGEVHANPDRMRKDMTRFAELRREGWLVLMYGPAEVFGRPWEIESEVRAALALRAPHLLRPRRVVS